MEQPKLSRRGFIKALVAIGAMPSIVLQPNALIPSAIGEITKIGRSEFIDLEDIMLISDMAPRYESLQALTVKLNYRFVRTQRDARCQITCRSYSGDELPFMIGERAKFRSIVDRSVTTFSGMLVSFYTTHCPIEGTYYDLEIVEMEDVVVTLDVDGIT